MSRTRFVALFAILVVAVLGGCSSSSSGQPAAGACTKVTGSFDIVAKNIAWEDAGGKPIKCLQAKAGEEVTFNIDNRDSIQHNLRIRGNGFEEKTELQTGPVKQTLKIKVPKAGDYTFDCEIHPNMKGSFTVT